MLSHSHGVKTNTLHQFNYLKTTRVHNLNDFLLQRKKNALEVAKGYVKRAVEHPSGIEFRKLMRESFGMYDGTLQWDEESLEILRERKQRPLVINLIQAFIDSLSGTEVLARFMSACRSDSHNQNDLMLASALTHWLFSYQEKNSSTHQGSLKFRDTLTCGLGWSNIYKQDEVYKYMHSDCFNLFPDFDDLSSQFTQMEYVYAQHFFTPNHIKKIWPEAAKKLDLQDDERYLVASSELNNRESDFPDTTSYSYNSSKLLVNEVQYKVTCKAYCGLDVDGRYFETFNEIQAKKIAKDQRLIERIDASKILRTWYIDDLLLEHGPISPSVPNPSDFGYIPFVWKRRYKTGVPYGLVESLKDLQREFNSRMTQNLYLINSTQIIADGDVMSGASIEEKRIELKRRDGVIIFPKDTKWQINSNSPLGSSQLEIATHYLTLFQRVANIHDEQLGIQSNATTGVAIKERRANSVRNNVFAFDNFSEMKKREAKLVLQMFQASCDENLAIEVLDDQEKKTIILNHSIDVDGKQYILNNINNLPLSIYIEEVKDVQSFSEEEREMLLKLMQTQNWPLIASSVDLLSALGFRDPERIARSFQKITNNQNSQSQDMDITPQMSQNNYQQMMMQ